MHNNSLKSRIIAISETVWHSKFFLPSLTCEMREGRRNFGGLISVMWFKSQKIYQKQSSRDRVRAVLNSNVLYLPYILSICLEYIIWPVSWVILAINYQYMDIYPSLLHFNTHIDFLIIYSSQTCTVVLTTNSLPDWNKYLYRESNKETHYTNNESEKKKDACRVVVAFCTIQTCHIYK